MSPDLEIVRCSLAQTLRTLIDLPLEHQIRLLHS